MAKVPQIVMRKTAFILLEPPNCAEIIPNKIKKSNAQTY